MGQNCLIKVQLFFLIKKMSQQCQLGTRQILKRDILKHSFQQKKLVYTQLYGSRKLWVFSTGLLEMTATIPIVGVMAGLRATMVTYYCSWRERQ